MAERLGGRPNRHEATEKRRAFLSSGALTFGESMTAAGLSPAAVVRLLDELGVKPRLVAMLSDDPDLQGTIAAMRGEEAA